MRGRMDPIHYLAVIQRLLFGFQLLAPRFKHDNAKLGFNELQRERYPRGTGADNAQITFQLRVGRNRPSVRYHSGRPNGAYRLVQMTRIGRADEGDGDCWLGKTERQGGLHRRLAPLKVAGEDLPSDHDRAAVGGPLQINQQVLSVWTKRRLNRFDALVGND